MNEKRFIGWLNAADAATDRDEVDRCLEQACQTTRGPDDWAWLLGNAAKLPLASRERVAFIADRVLENALTELYVYDAIDVASIRLRRLEDEAGARAALEAAMEAMREAHPGSERKRNAWHPHLPSSRQEGYDWLALADAFVDLFADEAARRRCLEVARASLGIRRKGNSLARIAERWGRLFDRGEGAVILDEAEQMEPGALDSYFAAVWRAWNEPDRARAAVERVLATATKPDDALALRHSWEIKVPEDEEVVRRGIVRAAELATTVDEWLEIVWLGHDFGLDEAFLRRALEGGEAVLASDSTSGAAEKHELAASVSGAYRAWLHDDEAADRIGQFGVRPSDLRVRIFRPLAGWERSTPAFFDWIRARTTPEALRTIAAKERYKERNKFVALVDLTRTGRVPSSLEYTLHQALVACARDSEGDAVHRALSATLLCIVPSSVADVVTSAVILLETKNELGSETGELLEQFFAWRIETATTEELVLGPERLSAMLALFILRADAAPDDPRLEPLCEDIVDHLRLGPAPHGQTWEPSLDLAEWKRPIELVLSPRRTSHRSIERLVSALDRWQPAVLL